jgi:hypothetical protein
MSWNSDSPGPTSLSSHRCPECSQASGNLSIFNDGTKQRSYSLATQRNDCAGKGMWSLVYDSMTDLSTCEFSEKLCGTVEGKHGPLRVHSTLKAI